MNRFDEYKEKHKSDYDYPRFVGKFIDNKYKQFKKMNYPTNRQTWEYVGYFENYYNEIMVNVIAYRWAKEESIGEYVERTKVLIACPKADYRWSKDMYVTMYGYKVNKDYWASGWAKVENTIYKIDDYRTTWLNKIDLPKYKYSCYDKIEGSVSNYLRFYEKYPSTEKLIKTGFDNNIVMSKSINKLVLGQKSFLKFMVRNQCYINYDYMCYEHATIPMIIKSFKKKLSLEYMVEERAKLEYVRRMNRDFCNDIYKVYPKIKRLIDSKYNNKKQPDYEIGMQVHSYIDYMNACLELELDLTDSKVYNPKEFQRMHDLRIDQLENKRLRARRNEDKAKNKERIAEKIKYDLKIKELSKNYLSMEYENEDYKILVAKNMRDFYTEAKKLKHCLYQMAYYKKFAEERDIIFFVRKKDKINEPFVTVEYDHKKKGIVQSYGYRDSKPDEQVKSFLNEWIETTKQIKNRAE